MKLNFNDYQIVTDDRQFIVQKKKVIQASKFTNPENVGKEYWEDEAYCSTLNFALKFLRKRVLLDNDDIKVVIEKLNELEGKINEFTKILKEEN